MLSGGKVSRRLLIAVGILTVVVVGGISVPLVVQADPDKPGVIDVIDTSLLPPDKQAVWDYVKQVHSEAQSRTVTPNAAQPPIDRTPKTPVLSPSIKRTAAGDGTIVESGLAPFSSADGLMENHWYVEKDQGSIIVFAGRTGNDPQQGLVIVAQGSRNVNLPKGELTKGGRFLTPTKAGSVHIVSAEGERLTLEAKDGTKFVFDVPSLQFVQ